MFMTISMIGAGVGSSTTDQIISNNKHSHGRKLALLLNETSHKSYPTDIAVSGLDATLL